MKTCPECELRLPLGRFVPRHRYKTGEQPPRAGRIYRQSRCVDCDRIYTRRRRFVTQKLRPLAESLGLDVQPKKGTVYRVLEVRGPEAERHELEIRVATFNKELPPTHSEVARHGVCLEQASEAVLQEKQLTFLCFS